MERHKWVVRVKGVRMKDCGEGHMPYDGTNVVTGGRGKHDVRTDLGNGK